MCGPLPLHSLTNQVDTPDASDHSTHFVEAHIFPHILWRPGAKKDVCHPPPLGEKCQGHGHGHGHGHSHGQPSSRFHLRATLKWFSLCDLSSKRTWFSLDEQKLEWKRRAFACQVITTCFCSRNRTMRHKRSQPTRTLNLTNPKRQTLTPNPKP